MSQHLDEFRPQQSSIAGHRDDGLADRLLQAMTQAQDEVSEI